MLRDAIAAALPDLRAEAESRMTSRAAVMRKTNVPTTNTDGFEVQGWVTVDPDCPGRLAGSPRGGAGTRSATAGGIDVQLGLREWHFPVTRPAMRDGDLIEVTAGENAGQVFRVVEGSGQDQATARRVPVIEAQRPEEWA